MRNPDRFHCARRDLPAGFRGGSLAGFQSTGAPVRFPTEVIPTTRPRATRQGLVMEPVPPPQRRRRPRNTE